ncbi:MAG: hypothetical protein AB1416_08345 [Actinomycetota bacterium]
MRSSVLVGSCLALVLAAPAAAVPVRGVKAKTTSSGATVTATVTPSASAPACGVRVETFYATAARRALATAHGAADGCSGVSVRVTGRLGRAPAAAALVCVRASQAIQGGRRSTHTACTPVPKPPAPRPAPAPSSPPASSSCDPNYSGCVPRYPPDVDCSDIVGPVRVIGSDVHGLDRDGDGVACDG